MEVYTNKVFTNLKKSMETLTLNFDELDEIYWQFQKLMHSTLIDSIMQL